MIVIGTDLVANYLADHASHKGIKAARTQYEAWLDIVARANWRNPEDVKASYPKASILKASRVVFNIKGNDYRLVARVQYQAGALAIRVLWDACRIRQDRSGDGVMDATVILIDSDAELARARALVDRLWDSNAPADIARLEAQARLIAAYEERKWPRQPPSTADLIRHLMDQHGLTRADMVPILGTPSRVSEVLRGKKGLSMTMVQRLRARFRVPADLLIPPPKKASARRPTKRAAA
jgi:antitoxin component HigA of HigAB toxin-antitoxin module/mRNA-degrading endonuclease HigB of HigAB toxin-antitoxin module